mmetsp:Transcript_4026/g.4149  ORF Transcript_4026/g.4149 Transcript_4026/m.4149 type:complete len:392 (-) Transcript_4026:283-1458(-)|eukprot:CAMPEP_0119051378 /NCGR_PEP_ID=MMETSP1177-20130426/73017_1 /TAXON_ID=2985 /ORGANISM="Ochromonas sp, Strain CCMP1899" /LENGTH=391 /DNA_ID=CAMNT_0007030563 /DNA_START=187 /DNA_END=1362 /DNA_ORIENTATION=+
MENYIEDSSSGQNYDEYGDQSYYSESGDHNQQPYYAESGELIEEYDENFLSDELEEESLFLSEWNEQCPASEREADAVSQSVWPHIDNIVYLKRLDLYQNLTPKSHQATIDQKESLKMRRTENWAALRSIFFLDQPLDFTKELRIETGSGPIRRQRFIPMDKTNRRDTSAWIPKETIHAYADSSNIPGVIQFFIDHVDSPDRYFISSSNTPTVACRRLFRFSAYPATQYYILGREIDHKSLESEGGLGTTYIIESGPFLKPRKHWRLIGSFYGFDQPLTCSNAYTVYIRQDPFPRMMIALDTFSRIEEWTVAYKFHAFDIPVPGTCCYSLQHTTPSIHSTDTRYSRHRLCSANRFPENPWDFRMLIYVFPARIEECSLAYDDTLESIVQGF